MTEISVFTELGKFGLMGVLLALMGIAYWRMLQTLLKQYQDERERYWKEADARAVEVATRLIESNMRADQRHMEIMKVLWRMNGRKEEL